jgi:hypothetical protein
MLADTGPAQGQHAGVLFYKSLQFFNANAANSRTALQLRLNELNLTQRISGHKQLFLRKPAAAVNLNLSLLTLSTHQP